MYSCLVLGYYVPLHISTTWKHKFKTPMCRILFAVGSIELRATALLGLNTVVVGKCLRHI